MLRSSTANISELNLTTEVGLNETQRPNMESDRNSHQIIYIKDLYDILEAERDNIQLSIHLNYMPILNEEEIILVFGLVCIFHNQTLKTKILNSIPNTKHHLEKIVKDKYEVNDELYNTIRKSIKKDPNFDIFTSLIRKRVIGQSFIIAVTNNLQRIYTHILRRSEELLINRKCLVDLARKRELKVLKSLLEHKYVVVQEERSKVSEIFGRIYGRSEGRAFNQIVLISVISEEEADFTDQEVLQIVIQDLKMQINEELICEFIKERRFEVINLLGREAVKVINKKALRCAINLEEWRFILKYIQRFIDNQLYCEETQNTSMGEILCDSLSSSYLNIEPKLFVCYKCLDYLAYENAESIIQIFLDSIQYLTNPKIIDHSFANYTPATIINNGFLVHSYNPIKICILIIELGRVIAKKYKNTRKLVDKLENSLLNLCLNIQQRIIVDDIEYRNVVLDKDLKGREVITIIQELELLPLLNNPETEKVIKTFWNSQYKLSGSFFDLSTNYHLLFKYPLQSSIDMEQKLRFKHQGRKFMPHFGQFHVWKESTFLRYLISTGFLVLICILSQVQLMNLNESIKYHSKKGRNSFILRFQTLGQLQEEMKTNSELLEEYNKVGYVEGDFESERRLLDFLFLYNPALKEISEDFTENLYKGVNEIKLSLYITIFLFVYLIQFILERIFSILENRHIRIIRPDIVLIILILILSISLYEAFYRTYEWCHPRYNRQSFAFSLNFCFVIKYSDQEEGYLEYHVTIMACLWVAVLYTLTITKIFGPLILIFIAMLKDIFIFLILFMLQLMVFACIGNILFIDLEGRYDTFGYCLLTLYQASLGEFDYDEFNFYLEKRKIIGKVYLTVFLLLSVILAINLLIAILSTTYALLWGKSTPLFLMENIKQRPLYKYSKRYGSLVSSFFPYYVFVPFLVPFLFMKNKIQINRLILHFEFIPIFLILYILFISVSVLFLPFCYMKIILHKIRLINRDDKSRCFGVLYLIIYIIFGLLIGLIQTIFIDTINFSRHIYAEHLPVLYEEKRLEVIPINKMNNFKLFLANLQSSKERPNIRQKKLGIYEFGNKFRENCGFKKELGKDYSYVLKLMNLQSSTETNPSLEKETNNLTLSQIFIFEQFARRNMIENTVQPALLLEIIDSCTQFKTFKNLITRNIAHRNIKQVYDSVSAKLIMTTRRETWVLHYLKLNQVLEILRREEKFEDPTKTLGRTLMSNN